MEAIDFRSDTVTRPDAGMRAALAAARVGDDVFGEDPTVRELETRCAQLLGHEAGLFFPSGTMANQAAIQVHVRPGDEVICGDLSHIYHYEGGGIARNAGASVRLVGGDQGRFTAEAAEAAINPGDSHFARTRLVAVEDTVNKGGGAVWDEGELSRLRTMTRRRGLGLHLDGARVWNAQVARGAATDRGADWSSYGRHFDSISVCLSKGLGAPVGSVLLGDRDFIREAHRVRKVMGGGMRQVGLLAAAGLYALDHQLPRLEADHALARQLAAACLAHPTVSGVAPVETNIVIFELRPGHPATDAVAALADLGVLAMTFGPSKVRLVTHRDIRPEQVARACEALATF